MKLGIIDMSNIMSGSIPITTVMRGTTLIWESGGGSSYLLDNMTTNAVSACSFRKLSSTADMCVNLYRASDNDSAMFYFGADDVISLDSLNADSVTMRDWVAGGDAKVNRWYDQSGNANDFTTFNLAKQPYFIKAGKLFLNGGIPSIDFDAAAPTHIEMYDNPEIGLAGDMAAHVVADVYGGESVLLSKYDGDTDTDYEIRADKDFFMYLDSNNVFDWEVTMGDVSLYSMERGENTNITLRYNGASTTSGLTGTLVSNTEKLFIGTRPDESLPIDGRISEVIIINEDGTPDSTLITDDIMAAYGIT